MAKWDVNQVYNFLKWLTNKNQSGGIPASDFFIAWNSEQASYHQDLVGRWQARSNGKSGPNTGLIQNETDLIELAPFTIGVNLPVTGGYVDWPTDFIYLASLRVNGAKVYHFNKDERWAVEEDVIDPPSISDDAYYFTEYANKYLILPTAVTSVDMDYIAACTDIIWASTPDANNRPVYDPSNSVQPQWNQDTIVTITKRSLKGIGVHFKDDDFIKYGESNINTGN